MHNEAKFLTQKSPVDLLGCIPSHAVKLGPQGHLVRSPDGMLIDIAAALSLIVFLARTPRVRKGQQ